MRYTEDVRMIGVDLTDFLGDFGRSGSKPAAARSSRIVALGKAKHFSVSVIGSGWFCDRDSVRVFFPFLLFPASSSSGKSTLLLRATEGGARDFVS
jgi:hypothetical protein